MVIPKPSLSKNTQNAIDEISTEEENKTSFVSDLNVYTRNRHFRLWKSSKLGSNRYLQIADENEHATPISSDQIFFDSMISLPIWSESSSFPDFTGPATASEGDTATYYSDMQFFIPDTNLTLTLL